MRVAEVEAEEAGVVRAGEAAEACRDPRAVAIALQVVRDPQAALDLQAALGCHDLRAEEAYRVHPVAAVSRGLRGAAGTSRGPHNSPPAVPRDRVVVACRRLHQSGPRAVNVHPTEGAPRSFHQAIAPAQRLDLPSVRADLRHVPGAAPSGRRKSQRVLALRIGLREARPVVPHSFPPNPAPALPNALV